MKVLIDTTVWSLVLRRPNRPENAWANGEVAALVNDGRVVIIGPIRQEALSGIAERVQFDQLREHLRAFPDFEITSDDYEEAAHCFNRCREKGIQGSHIDFLICAIALRHELSIFTTDDDFKQYATVLPIVLHQRSRH
ncbi:MAG TPA: PIN domain-containing protein [Thermoanaerobaculia bacterium]|nr:PIN domain-containing protein [Thermoanaerobaculia bacterium]